MLKVVSKLYLKTIISGQFITTSHELTPKGSWGLFPQTIFATFFFGNGVRIGEAKNPGPVNSCEIFRIGQINPTSLPTRTRDFLNIGADVIALSETSATQPVQIECAKNLRPFGYSCVFSEPVDSQKQRLDGEISRRGQSAGTAIFSKLPIRQLRQPEFPSPQHQTRLQAAMVQLGASTVLICTLYGFQQNQTRSKPNTNRLLREAAELVLEHPGPSIVIGDFNHDLNELDSWTLLKDAGFIDSITVYDHIYGEKMPSTYQEATCRDIAIFSNELSHTITGIDVDHTAAFPGHHPVVYTLKLPEGGITKQIWRTPQDWTQLQITPSLLEYAYDSVEPIQLTGDVENNLSLWSEKVETAIDQALRLQHSIDPIRCPFDKLPAEYRGRCKTNSIQQVRFRAFGPQARKTDFEPQGEIKTHRCAQLLRQVRRLESLKRRLEKVATYSEVWNSTKQGLQQEWDAIRRAKGFGRNFETWILEELEWPLCPRYTPPLSVIQSLEAVVKNVFQQKLHQDQANAKKHSSFQKTLDHEKCYDRQTYKAIKEPPKQFIQGLNVTQSLPCSLHRVHPQFVEVRLLQQEHNLHPGEEICIMGHPGIVQGENDDLTTICFDTSLLDFPDHFDIQVTRFGMTPSHIHKALIGYWKPIWNRDPENTEEEFDPFFRDLLQQTELPQVCDSFQMNDIEQWERTIKNLGTHSAPGPDGWYNSELKQRPRSAVRELVAIFQHDSFHGFPETFMTARVVALPKQSLIDNASQTRPITILPTLFRLWTANFSRLTLANAHNTLPAELTGFVKGRGGSESMYSLAWDIEQAHATKINLAGITLDLSKAFNQFPRKKTAALMKHMGAPAKFVDQWFHSLNNIGRFFDHRGYISDRIPCTTGVAEGDAASIVAMLAISVTWVELLRDTGIKSKAYADNLSWSSQDFQAHEDSLIRTIRYFENMQVPIDWSKTWVWCTKTSQLAKWKDIGQRQLPEGQQLQPLEASVDLGVVQNYGPIKRLLTTRERLAKAKTRLEKLYRQNLAVPIVAKIIQSAVWPLAFYAVENCALGRDHFHQLRVAAAQALVHHHKPGIATLATHLASKTLVDPEVYAIEQALRSARKFLAHLASSEQKSFLWQTTRSTGKSHSVRGPASALKNYLQRVGWNIDIDGFLHTAGLVKLHILEAPWKDIKRFLAQDWLRDVIPLFTERKALAGAPLIHRELTVNLLSKVPPKTQRGILREISSTYQLESQKQKWTSDADGTCRHCAALDDKAHRTYKCPATEDVWSQYPNLCATLEEHDRIHTELPVVFASPTNDFLQVCQYQKLVSEIPENISRLIQAQIDLGITPTFFSDGSCIHPETPAISLAAWGLVWALANTPEERNFVLSNSHDKQIVQQQFAAIGTGRCHGAQTIDRAELQAMIFLQQQLQQSILVTDSQYALDSWEKVKCASNENEFLFAANSDLLSQLFQANQHGNHRVLKVKSHTWIDGTSLTEEPFLALGNEVVDQVAKAANFQLHPPMVQEWTKEADEMIRTITWKKQHYQMLGELHQLQTRMGEKDVTAPTSAVPVFLGHVGQSIFEVFANYKPQQFFHKEIFWDEDIPLDNEWTNEMSSHLLQFWQDIEWSSPTRDEVGRSGITWTELALSFMFDRQVAIPTRIPNTGHMTFDINQLRNNGYGFFHVPKSFFWLAQKVNKDLNGALFSGLERGQTCSLQRMGSTNQGRGFVYRPGFPMQQQVASTMERYFSMHGRFSGVNLWPQIGETESDNEFFWANLQIIGN